MISRRTFILGLCVLRPACAAWEAAAAYNAQCQGASLLVMVDGRVVYEAGADKAYQLASGTKSFVGVMALAAAREGLLRLDEPCCVTLPEWANDARRSVTIRQLLTLSSGMPGGTIGKPPLYADAVATALGPPGFHYGPLPFQVFGEIMRRKLGASPLGYLEEKVLRPGGVEYARWQQDRAGNPTLPSGASMTARNWARFGEWIRLARDLGPLFQGTAENPAYGLTWWLNRRVEPALKASIQVLNSGTDLPSEAVPGDLVMAAGMGKQRLYVIPSRKLVAVRQTARLAGGERAGYSDTTMVGHLLAGLR